MSSNNLVNSYLEKINDDIIVSKVNELLKWIEIKYPSLKLEFKWKQPMFTMNGTYIIGFSLSKNHLTVGLEAQIMNDLRDKIIHKGFKTGKMTIQFPYKKEFDYDLIDEIIKYVIKEKENVKSFWF